MQSLMCNIINESTQVVNVCNICFCVCIINISYCVMYIYVSIVIHNI